MNTRTVEVLGAGGRQRPMFFGQWTDEVGTVHRRGMADLLLTPRVAVWPALQANALLPISQWVEIPPEAKWNVNLRVTVPLWVECKSGTGKLESEQIAFRDYVKNSGAYYIEAHDCADAVIEWFKFFGVFR